MSHRFRDDMTTLRRRLQAGGDGPVEYLVGRLLCSYRKYGDWGQFRHEIDDPLLVEAAVHHLDLLADMAGGHCDRLYAETWLPDWGPFAGDGNALVTMHFDNDTRATYEGALANATAPNCWGSEYVRAECRDATYALDDHELERYGLDADSKDGETIGIDEQVAWSNTWLIEQFVEWLDGGEPMATNVRDNLRSMALVAAAIESSETGVPVNPQDLLAKAHARVEI